MSNGAPDQKQSPTHYIIITKMSQNKIEFSKYNEIKIFQKRIQRDISKTPQQDMTQINDELTKAFKKFNLPEVT